MAESYFDLMADIYGHRDYQGRLPMVDSHYLMGAALTEFFAGIRVHEAFIARRKAQGGSPVTEDQRRFVRRHLAHQAERWYARSENASDEATALRFKTKADAFWEARTELEIKGVSDG